MKKRNTRLINRNKQLNDGLNKKFKPLRLVSFNFALLSFVPLGFGIYKIDNYINDVWFGLIFSTLGLLIGILFYYLILCKTFKDLKNYNRKGWSISAGFIIGFVGYTFGIASFMNKNEPAIINTKEYAIEEKSQGVGRNRENYLFVKIDKNIERIICSDKYWKSVNVGENIKLRIITGKLGFDFIEIENE
ncbi:hypothetical protein [Flavobacterium sp. 245]|uniref:hypothetical protein n=1 Tax=Flavobacterium sp. 245 TaxID=2512115 RepID=UPI001060DC48|nr:hypothetical protein [Flavobacterium sp. 245]TDP02445.1 hypothetical protein EV145_103435 [Flavobacterium sp. 245]